jgi:flagellar hook-basal body complex protein FliE
MSAEMIAPVTAAASLNVPQLQAMNEGAQGAGSFGAMVTQGLQQVNGQLLATQGDLQALAVGDVQNLHQVMIRMEESRIAFQLMMQVRNRLLEAYQDVMKMQI